MKNWPTCLLFGALLLVHAAPSVAQDDVPLAEQTAILRGLFTLELNDPSLLERAMPNAWLVPGADLSDARKEAEARLLKLRNNVQENVQENAQDDAADNAADNAQDNTRQTPEMELLVLQIQWLKLSPEARTKQLADIAARHVARSSELKASQLINQAQRESAAATAAQAEIQQQASTTLDERTAILLQRLLILEQQKQSLAQAKVRLGEIQRAFVDSFALWKSLESDIYKAVEAANNDYLQYRPRIRQLLRESNERVKRRDTFEKYALGDVASQQIVSDVGEVVARTGDGEDVKKLVQDIYEASINLATSYELFLQEREALLVKQITWEKDYRHNLLAARGRIISRLKTSEIDIDGGEPLLQEGRTIVYSLRFMLWSFKPLYVNSNSSDKRSVIQAFYDYANLFKVLVFVAIATLLLVKKQFLIDKIRIYVQRWFGKRSSYVRNMTMELAQGLYVFFVLLLLGNLIIQFGVELGFSFLANLKPLLMTVLYFFLGWGFVDFLRPIISQRRFRNAASLNEVKAMEVIFEAIPKLVLLYFLISTLSAEIFYLWLNESFISDMFTGFYRAVLLIALLWLVWKQREQWRLVADKAVDSPGLDRILVQSVNKIWEPLVLLFAGGVGVYLVTWRLLKARISELEFARSFQAMVSRALLERRRRNSTVRVLQERFPDGYLDDFNYETRAHPDWHVERRDALERLREAHERWMRDKQGTTVLLVGDRGVGKSELVYQFFRAEKVEAIECKLKPGDSCLDDVLATLSQALFQSAPLSLDEFNTKLKRLPPSVILLENLENAILRQIDGFDAFASIVDSIMATSGQHLWLVTFTTYAWTIAKRAVPGADCFSQYIYLHGMNEDEIKQLILRRHARNHVLKLNFSNLSLENVPRRRKNLSQQETEERRQNLYFRILWDYTGGNPRQALYFWKTSLEFVGDEAKVNLFEIPEQGVLESLRDKSLMLLAALVEHNGLTVGGLATVLNESNNNVRRWIEELTPFGIIYSFGKADDLSYGWHIESFWISAVEAYLSKRQLLFHGGTR